MKKRLNRIAVAVFFAALSIAPVMLASNKQPVTVDGMPGSKQPGGGGVRLADGMPGSKQPGGGGVRLADGMPGSKQPGGGGVRLADGMPGSKQPGGGGVRSTLNA